MNHVASDRIFLLASLVAVACAAFYERLFLLFLINKGTKRHLS